LQLLVSVRSADEVGPALQGGADIIDAKDPDRGSLGPVLPATLAEIFRCTPDNVPFSAALGDFTRAEEVVESFCQLRLPPRGAPTYLKLGFAGAESLDCVSVLLKTAVRVAQRWTSPPRIVAVAYADAGRSESPPPELVCQVAAETGVTGVLIDTKVKDGRGLLNCLSDAELAEWVCRARRLGLLTGVAGALDLEDLPSACQGLPDVVGFRGAACVGGRSGRVAPKRVALLRSRLDGVATSLGHFA
jgi:(5-formylfuran-3-yl)methyl phosphate synthase